jgi:hypothetical protein
MRLPISKLFFYKKPLMSDFVLTIIFTNFATFYSRRFTLSGMKNPPSGGFYSADMISN